MKENDPCLKWAANLKHELKMDDALLQKALKRYHNQGMTCDEVQAFVSRQAMLVSLTERKNHGRER